MKKILLLALALTLPAFGKTAYNVYRMPSSGNIPGWGAINLGQSAAVTGTLGLGNGGLGIAACTSGDIPYSNGSVFVCDDFLTRHDSSTLVTPNLISVGGFSSGNAILGGYSSKTISVADGAAASTSNYPIVTSWSNSNQTSPTTGLVIVRGQVDSAGSTINIGEGFTSSSGGTGIFNISFTTTFGSAPVITCSCFNNSQDICFVNSTTTSSAQIKTFKVDLTSNACTINFIAIGQR